MNYDIRINLNISLCVAYCVAELCLFSNTIAPTSILKLNLLIFIFFNGFFISQKQLNMSCFLRKVLT